MIGDQLSLTDTLISSMANASPPVSALTLAYAKLHIRAINDADDVLIAVWIDAAAAYFESQTGRQLLTATREVWLDSFPFVGASGRLARIELPHPPLQSVVSVSYLDGSGVLQTAAAPHVSAPAGPYASRGWVEPMTGSTWPIAQDATGSVRIRYTCGYGDDPDDVPALARGILCYLVAHFDTFRAAVHEARRGQVLELPYGVQMMLDGFRVLGLADLRVAPVGAGAVMAVTLVLGELRQVVTLSAPGPAMPDGDGGYTQTYAPLSPATWRCAIQAASVRASERHFAATVIAHASYILSGRYHPGITTTTRMVWTDRSGAVHTADVLDVDDTEGAGVETVVLVSEVVDAGTPVDAGIDGGAPDSVFAGGVDGGGV